MLKKEKKSSNVLFDGLVQYLTLIELIFHSYINEVDENNFERESKHSTNDVHCRKLIPTF